MRSFSAYALATVTAASLGLSGCGGDGAEPAEVHGRINTLLPGLVSSTSNAMSGSETIPARLWLDQGLATMSNSFPTVSGLMPDVGLGEEDVSTLDVGETEDPGAALAAMLNEYIFTKENYEGDGYYRLRGNILCETETVVGEDEEGTVGTSAVDEECAAQVDQAEIRFRAALAGDGLDIGLAIGPNRDEPLLFELRSDSLAVALDLAEAKAAVDHLSGGEAELPSVMEGVVALALRSHGPDDASIEVAVREAVRVETSLLGLPVPIRFTTEAKEPLMAMRFRGTSEMSFDLDLGRTELSMPWSMTSEFDAGEAFSLVLGGMSASTTLRADATEAVITNIGLGDVTTEMRLDDHVLVALDLNATEGRRFDLTIKPSETGLPTFELSPGFELSMKLDLAPLAAAGELIEEHLLDETYRFALTGDKPAIQPVDPTLDGSFTGGLRVTSGTLSISSSSAPAPVEVEAGTCLTSVEAPVDAHPVIDSLTATVCP